MVRWKEKPLPTRCNTLPRGNIDVSGVKSGRPETE
jgi:hypothetical protein